MAQGVYNELMVQITVTNKTLAGGKLPFKAGCQKKAKVGKFEICQTKD